jgi:hypothetical protein
MDSIANLNLWPAVAVGATLIATCIVLINRIKDQHRSRRTAAIDLMQFWVESFYRDGPLNSTLRRLLCNIDPATAERIEKRQRFVVPDAMVDYFKDVMRLLKDEPELVIRKGSVVEADEATLLRHKIMNLLNVMECVAASYVNHVSDQDIVFHEFRRIFFDEDQPAFETYLDKIERYPSIKDLSRSFKEKIDAQRKSDIRKKRL